MDQLKQAVSQAFDNIVASGAIEKAIQEQIGKCVESAIKDQFSSYGDFNKAVKAKIASLVDINLDNIDLPSYRDLVGKIIQQRVGAAMNTQFTEQLSKDIDELLLPAPAEITLEQLLKEFVDQQMDKYDADEYRGERFTLHIDHATGLTKGYKHVYIDRERHKSQYSCDIQISLQPDGTVYGLKIDGVDPSNQLFVGKMYGFERMLFQMYTAQSKLIVSDGADADDFDTTFPGGDDVY